MPLLDHFHPPLSEHRHWEGFHGAWAGEIARQLNNELLPPRYFAEPLVRWGSRVEIDVATFEEPWGGANEPGGTQTAVWSPPKPARTFPVDFSGIDVAEVRVYSGEAGPRLVAAIELVSPANKDRPAHRRAFANKCAAYLQASVALVVVDIVTGRNEPLHAELLALLALRNEPDLAVDLLSVVAYRSRSTQHGTQLDVWTEGLAVGRVLPTVPLWLDDTALPLNLEETYTAACRALRI